MSALVTPNSGDVIQASHISQLTGLVAGTAGRGQATALTDIGSASWVTANAGSDASALWALTVRNQNTSTGQALRVQNSAGTAIMEVDDAATQIGAGTKLVIDHATNPAGPRAYIDAPTATKTLFQTNRGTGLTSGSEPDATYSAAIAAYSYQAGVVDRTGEAIKGFCYAASGSGGFHIGVSGVAEVPATSNWSASGTHGVVGLFGQASSYKTGGRVWGANVIANGFAATTSDMVGLEVGVEATAAVTNRYGVQIITLAGGNNSGATEDIAIKLADKNGAVVEGNLWAVGLAFGSPGVTAETGYPIKATGTLIKSYGTKTIANGIDFSGHAFSGFAIKTDTFMVNPVGRVSVRTNSAPTGAPIVIDATSDTYNIQINNPVTQSTVGAAGGASALPATPTGYLIARIGTTDAVIPYYAKS